MNTKPALHGSSDLMKNVEAQETPPLKSYLWLTMFTCFCPAWPINIVALVFSVLAQKSYDDKDYDGSMRLGRKALHMGIVSLLVGLVIITVYIIVHFTTLSPVSLPVTPHHTSTLTAAVGLRQPTAMSRLRDEVFRGNIVEMTESVVKTESHISCEK